MFSKFKNRRHEKDHTPPVQVTDSFILHFEDIRPTHRAVKIAHRLVYLVGFSMIGSSLALCASRAIA
jgi:hypothetical protein